jgi:hypothetical protein
VSLIVTVRVTLVTSFEFAFGMMFITFLREYPQL